MYGQEWSFGHTDAGTGVFACEPMQNRAHIFRETIDLGEVEVSPVEVEAIIARLKPLWMGPDYHMVHRNCCSFCEAFAKELRCPLGIPAWLNSLAETGAPALRFSYLRTRICTLTVLSSARAGSSILGWFS